MPLPVEWYVQDEIDRRAEGVPATVIRSDDDDDDRDRDNTAPSSVALPPLPAPPGSDVMSLFNAELDDQPSTWGLMNEITAQIGPEAYPGLYNFSGQVGFTEQEIEDYVAAVETWGAGQDGSGSFTFPPVLPPPTSETGYQPPEVKWETGTYEAAGDNTPDWWRPMVPQSSDDYNRPDAVFTMMMNAMIPHLSPEDQVTVGRQLYTMWGNDFSMYKDLDVNAQVSPEQSALGIEGNIANVNYFRSPERAQEAVSTLSNLRESTVEGNRWKFGPGYKFLQELMEAYGNVGKTTRANTVQTLGQLDPLLSSTQSGELAPYAPIANMLTNPFFSRFQLTPTSRTETGEYVFGKPSKQLHF